MREYPSTSYVDDIPDNALALPLELRQPPLQILEVALQERGDVDVG